MSSLLDDVFPDPREGRNPPKPGTYIVIRVAYTYPHQVPPDLDGKWFDLAEIPVAYPGAIGTMLRRVAAGVGVAHETNRWEEREDGAIAQVWEIR